MSINPDLLNRSNNACELCGNADNLQEYIVDGAPEGIPDVVVVACGSCHAQITESTDIDINHWRCLNDAMWSPVPAVKVMAYRMLHKLRAEGWPQELLDMMYLEPDELTWAKAGINDNQVVHKDSNGNILNAGDSVTLIQDLNVKGANFTAKRGTAVRNIRLDPDNAEHIEGKVNGQMIVILTKYVKKK